MTAPYDRRSDVFTDWLDAQVTGKSTPGHELAADADLADLCAAADQFHGLAERLGQDATRVSPSTRSWEDIMATNSASFSTPPAGVVPRQSVRSASWRESPSRQRFDRFVTGALAIALVVAIVGGAWLAASRGPFGGGNSPSATNELAGLAPDGEASNWTEVLATPDVAVVDLPTADECTIEPLTVDDVIWYIAEPYQARYRMNEATPMAPDRGITENTRALVPNPNDPSAQEQMAATQRMWMACVLAKSPFQAWALVDPHMVAGFFQLTLPRFITEAEVREMLEAMWADPEASVPMLNNGYPLPSSYATCADVWVLSGAPGQTIVLTEGDEAYVRVAAAGYDLAGNLVVKPQTPSLDGSPGQGNTFDFVWNHARSTWLIASEPQSCG